METKYTPVIGLEIHVELKTKSKMFCQCAADYFEKEPNSNTCPVCLGMPGALPVPNKKAIEWTILIGQALNCKINKISKFDRKHYFYADLPKGYQISQYDEPIASQGWLEVPSDKEQVTKKFRITRVHLEEDTGKLIHKGDETLIDFNRSGVPLVEIVTEPDFDSSEDVKKFLEELHTIIKEYLQVSEANLDRGDMRLEPNISLKKITDYELRITNIKNQSVISNQKSKNLPGYKVEVKNINSFNFAKRAVDYEIKRQAEILDKGEIPIQETRGWDEVHNKTVSQRTKEEAHDYRYFPEPDIPPLEFTQTYLEKIKKQLPELPAQKMKRFVEELNIKQTDAFSLTRSKAMSDYFEKLSPEQDRQKIANLVVNKKVHITQPIKVSESIAIELLTPKKTDNLALEGAISKIFEANKKAVEEYKSGKENAIMFLVGQVMREMKGQADANVVKSALVKKLK